MNNWTKFKETTQIIPVLMLDCLVKDYGNFKKFHDGKTEIRRYGQFLSGRWMGQDDIKNYEKMMGAASLQQLLIWSGNFRRYKNELLNLAKKISETDFSHFSNIDLINLFSKYVSLCAKAYLFTYDYVMLNKTYSEKINKIVFKKVKSVEILNYYLPYIAGLDKPTDMHKAKKEIGMMAIYAKDNGLNERVKNRVKKYCKNYGYLKTFAYFGEPYTEKEIHRKLKQLAKKDKKEILEETTLQINQLSLNKKKTEEFIKKYKLNQKDKKIIKVLKDYIYTSLWADELYHRIPCLVRPILIKICRRLKISYKHLIFMTVDEILGSLKFNRMSKSLLQTINRRINNFAFLYDNGKIKLLSDEALNKFTANIIKRQKRKLSLKLNEIKGQPACAGKVKGVIKVIKNVDDIRNFGRGKILVATSTSPMHVPAMERAMAIITDEGGLLSHAAIIGREFKKPCIVGTKIATKVLKDGDLVEVDANKGIVKILEKK